MFLDKAEEENNKLINLKEGEYLIKRDKNSAIIIYLIDNAESSFNILSSKLEESDNSNKEPNNNNINNKNNKIDLDTELDKEYKALRLKKYRYKLNNLLLKASSI